MARRASMVLRRGAYSGLETGRLARKVRRPCHSVCSRSGFSVSDRLSRSTDQLFSPSTLARTTPQGHGISMTVFALGIRYSIS